MNGFDIALSIAVCVLTVTGFAKGLVKILIGFAALIAAFLLASQLHEALAARLSWVTLPHPAALLIAYASIFVGVMLAGAVVAFVTRTVLRAAMLGWADRLGGAALGFATAMTLAALFVLPFVAYTPAGSAMLGRSLLAPYVAAIADIAAPFVPEGLSDLYEQRIDVLRQTWRDGWFDAQRES